MSRIYVLVTAVLYLVFAVWCSINPLGTASSLGFAFPKASAYAEYIVVYGGLELGVALFLFLAYFKKSWTLPAAVFMAIKFICLAVYRCIALNVLEGDLEMAHYMFVIEFTFALWGALILFKERDAILKS